MSTNSYQPSVFAREFDSRNPNWQDSPEYNLLYLRSTEQYLNHLLTIRGHVLLNDVYDQLGFERTPAGCVNGWLKSKDGHIDFGVFPTRMPTMSETITLDFNVQGDIHNDI